MVTVRNKEVNIYKYPTHSRIPAVIAEYTADHKGTNLEMTNKTPVKL